MVAIVNHTVCKQGVVCLVLPGNIHMVAIVNYTVCKQGVVCLVLPGIHTYGGNSKLHCMQARCSVPSVARHTYIWWQ